MIAYERMRKLIDAIRSFPAINGVYDLKKTIRFDLVVSFDAKDRKAVYRDVVEQVQKQYPAYKLDAAMDTDFIAS